MSHTAKEPTNPGPTPIKPTLNPDKDTLISEFKKLDSMLAAINNNIQAQNDSITEANEMANVAQQNIATLRTQGLQIVGQADVLARILRSMDVDVDQYITAPPGVASQTESPPAVSDVPPPVESEETPAPKRGLKNRFSPR